MMKLRIILAALLFSIMGASTAYAGNPCGLQASKIMNEIRNPHRKELTLLVAHRGLHAVLGSEDYKTTPENSLQSIKNADDRCFEMIELDVRLTSDGIPILSHDYRWGRQAEIYDAGPCCYDPWANTGPNPDVASTSSWRVQEMTLRNSVNFQKSPWDEKPPTLKDAYQYYWNNNMQLIFTVDVKDERALRAAWKATVESGMINRVIFKAGYTTFPKPSVFRDAMSTRYVSNNGQPDSAFIHFIPVWNTENIKPDSNGGAGEGKLVDSVRWYKEWASKGNDDFFVAAEVNIKNYGHILAETLIESAHHGENSTTAIFNPHREYLRNGMPEYFSSDGTCCVPLSTYFFNGSPWGLRSDGVDLRTNWAFLKAHVEQDYLNMITSDNVIPLANNLAAMGRRNTLKYLR